MQLVVAVPAAMVSPVVAAMMASVVPAMIVDPMVMPAMSMSAQVPVAQIESHANAAVTAISAVILVWPAVAVAISGRI